ncbi:MAG: flagellar hook-length control protein FliK [Candidatus Eremiobacteraeota bacterium]|nr:flagellar hook-length control protein FliK [Candidatus Eremiobacteraeota bacterium]
MEALISLLSNLKSSFHRASSGNKNELASDKNLKPYFFRTLNSVRDAGGICDISGNSPKKTHNKKKNAKLQTAPLAFDSNIMKEILSPLISQMNVKNDGNDCKPQKDPDTKLSTSLGKYGNFLNSIINDESKGNNLNVLGGEIKQVDKSGKTVNGNLSNLQPKVPDKLDENEALTDFNSNKNNLKLPSTNRTSNVAATSIPELLSTGRHKHVYDLKPGTLRRTDKPGEVKVNLSVGTGNIAGRDKVKLIPDEKHSDNSKLEFQYIKKFNNNDQSEKLQTDPKIRIEDQIEETSTKDIKHLDEVIVKNYSSNELSALTNVKEKEPVGVKLSDLTEKLTETMTRFSNQEANNREIVEIRLEPPRLGKVNITLQMENEVLRTDFVCSREAAEYIRESIPELVSALAQNGITLGESNINLGWGRSPEDSGRNKWESSNSSDDKSTNIEVDSEDTIQIVGESRYSFLI